MSEEKKRVNYYPFGLKHKGYNNVTSGGNASAQKRGITGKEYQDELGLNWSDFGARNYDASLGRWMNMDPVAEIAPDWTPYRYAFNNPLMFIDPDGMYEWRVNTETGKYERFGDEGGDKEQFIFFNNDKTSTGSIKGSKIYVGAVSTNWHKDGDITFGVSGSDLWSDLPDEYQGAYTASDLAERRDAKKQGGAKWESIQDQEGQGLARRDQIWNNKDYARSLYNRTGSTSALMAAYDTGLLEEMLPGPDFSDLASFVKNYKRAMTTKFKANANTAKLAKTSSKFSKNSWIRFLQKNKGKYKGKGYGKNWVKKAADDYHKTKNKSKK